MDRYGFELWPEWKVVRKIGSGSFGNVYEIHRRNGEELYGGDHYLVRAELSGGVDSLPERLLEGVEEEIH